MAQEFVKESKLPEYPVKKLPQRDDFDSETLGIGYYAHRIDPVTFEMCIRDRCMNIV